MTLHEREATSPPRRCRPRPRGRRPGDGRHLLRPPGRRLPRGQHRRRGDLQAALNTAASTAADDVVSIGPGTWTAPQWGFVAGGLSGLQIVGSGDATVLQGDTSPIVQLNRGDLSSVSIVMPATNNTNGINVAGAHVIDHVSISGGANNAQAVSANGGVLVRDSTIDVPAGTAMYAAPWNGASPTLQDSTITARTTLYMNGVFDGPPAVLQRTTSTGGKLDVMANGGGVVVRDAVLHHLSGGSEALYAETAWSRPGTLVADHVTVLGDGNGTAINAYSDVSGATSSVTVTNSVVRNFAKLTNRWAGNGGTANITFSYSDAHPLANGDSGDGAVTFGAGMVDLADPGFASLADPRPLAGSALIDAGDPATPGTATDRAGNPRPSGARQDIGAYEWQAPAPAGGGGAAATGDPVPAAADDAAPVVAAATPSIQGRPVDVRALLRQAIAGARGHRYTFTWPQAGTVRFAWIRHGRTLASGRATRTAPGTATVTVKGAKRLPRGARVRATFTPQGGAPVVVSAQAARRP